MSMHASASLLLPHQHLPSYLRGSCGTVNGGMAGTSGVEVTVVAAAAGATVALIGARFLSSGCPATEEITLAAATPAIVGLLVECRALAEAFAVGVARACAVGWITELFAVGKCRPPALGPPIVMGATPRSAAAPPTPTPMVGTAVAGAGAGAVGACPRRGA